MYIKNLAQLRKQDMKIAGGKAVFLGEMIKAKFLVPEGFVILASAFKLCKNSYEIEDDVTDEILANFDNLNSHEVVVRSSATVEDSVNDSWAGIFESYLRINRGDLLSTIKKCWQSSLSSKALAYAKQRHIDTDNINMAVIVQELIRPSLSGVCFTVNPINKNHDQLMIEVCHGGPEDLVSGKITPDNFVVNKKTKEIEEQNLFAKTGITKKQIDNLVNSCIEVENFFTHSCDIEWCIDGSNLFVLQSRPITTL